MTRTNRVMICTSCEKPKAQLKKRKSKVLPPTPITLCQDCLDRKLEPRGFVILAGRKFGTDHIAEWIKHKRYLGDDITVRELT